MKDNEQINENIYRSIRVYNLKNDKKNRMKSTKPAKQQKQSLKLPSIGNKTMGEMYKQTAKQKQRPLSSKNIVNDLEKKLFSQLQAYDEKSLTGKFQKNKSKAKPKLTTSINMANSCKDIANNGKISDDSESMQKIAQLMPHLYSKILQSKKADDIKPLKETFILNHQEKLNKQHSSNNQQKKKPQKVPSLQSTTTRAPSAKPSKQIKEQQPDIKDSFSMAQKQLDSIYLQYLQQQGLDQIETPVSQLQELNSDLDKCQVDITELERNYSALIKQLGDLCVNEIE